MLWGVHRQARHVLSDSRDLTRDNTEQDAAEKLLNFIGIWYVGLCYSANMYIIVKRPSECNKKMFGIKVGPL